MAGKSTKASTMGQKIAPPRFLAFVVLLIAATAVGWSAFSPAHAFMIGFDIAAGAFLLSIVPLFRATTPADMRKHAAENDANRVMLLVIATAVTAAIFTSVASELGSKGKPDAILIVTTLVLSWLFANTIYALHYAHIYYLEGSKGGLDFAGNPDNPDYSDFVYFAYTLGMTFQTSDTGVETRALRRIVTIHSFVSFIFNIGVLAFTINVLGGGH